MDYQFSFNTRMLVLLCVALVLLLGLSVGVGVLIGRAWPGDGGVEPEGKARAGLPKAPSALKAATAPAADAK